MTASVSLLSSRYSHPPGLVIALALSLATFFSSTTLRAQDSSPLLSLVASERGFAAATAELGVRNGFLTFFADSAITFQPELGLYRETLTKRPLPQYPLTALLRWAPEEGDVALSGDIGYTTGPAAVESVSPSPGPGYNGWFFSIWKRQSTGIWKVFIDVGIETPTHGITIDSVRFVPAALHGSEFEGGTTDGLQSADKLLNELLRVRSGSVAEHFISTIRFHRNGRFPMKGTAEVQDYLADQPYGTSSGIRAEVSEAGDLGFTYGTYANPSASGYYIRIWKLTHPSEWKVVLDVTTEQR